MFPTEALAHELVARGWRVVVVTDRRGQGFSADTKDLLVERIHAANLKPGLFEKVRAILQMGRGYFQARTLLKKLRPAVVVGFGGYASVPTVLAAQHLNIQTVLHEQNAILGKANKVLATDATRIATSLPSVVGLKAQDEKKVIITGNPVRSAVRQLGGRRYVAPDVEGEFRIFITGGSQGAGVFGHIVPDALALLPDDLKSRLRVVQQCRQEDIGVVRRKSLASGIEVEAKTFFEDVAQRLDWCHLIICRAGGSTVAEICAIGRPAIFVPATYHTDDQQKLNAEIVAEAGGGWVMVEPEFTPEALAKRLEQLMGSSVFLEKAAGAAVSCGQLDAVGKLGDLVCEIAEAETGGSNIPTWNADEKT